MLCYITIKYVVPQVLGKSDYHKKIKPVSAHFDTQSLEQIF